MANWYTQLESRIFTLVGHRLRKALKDSVTSTIKCTTESSTEAEPYFPTWYLHELTPIETGQDLDNKSVNAVIETIEVIVYTRTKDDCRVIMDETVSQMKEIRFDVIAMPIITSESHVAIGMARFRRVVGSGDTDLVVQ